MRIPFSMASKKLVVRFLLNKRNKAYYFYRSLNYKVTHHTGNIQLYLHFVKATQLN